MKALLPYFLLLCILSCKNDGKPDAHEYSQSDLKFIKKADSICRTIDAGSLVERTKNGMTTDPGDGHQYPTQYYGYAKSSLDSIDKFLMNMVVSDTEIVKTTFYYYDGVPIKCLAEAFGQDTLRVAYYYDGDNVIYPSDVKRETGEGFHNEATYWRTTFPPTDSAQLKTY
jgi:hypothetical protein